MTRLRPTTLARHHRDLGDRTLAWQPSEEPTSLDAYLVRHGVAHLFALARRDDAERRLLDLPYMAAFADAYDTFVEPLKAWRAVGLERARDGYARVAEGLGAVEDGREEDADGAARVASFLRSAGLYEAGVALAQWALEVREQTLGAEDAKTLGSVAGLAALLRSQGRYAEAEPLFLRALEARERTLGREHPDTLGSVGSLALLYQSQGA